jgi:predicted secreted acid phosphatase
MRRWAAAGLLLLAGAAQAGAAAPDTPPATMQYLYGSAEAAALSTESYSALLDHVRRARSHPRSVVLARGATLAQPRFTACGHKPLAAVFDMDETVVLNLGIEYDTARSGEPLDEARWQRWEKSGVNTVAPVPGAVLAFGALRKMGVTPIVNTNRSAGSAEAAAAMLAAAGLGRFEHGKTLFLRGDIDGQLGKDGRRWQIAEHYCVVSLAGDQLIDISDRFIAGDPAERRAAVQAPSVAGLWGEGWFVLPNPVYGSGVAGDWEQVFPRDKRWTDPVRNGGK